MLRARGVTQKIGFFLHIPFPAPEILTTLPVHDEIIQALAQYDLVGFQTQTDQTAFTDYILRERREQVYGEGWVQAFGRRFRVGTFPIAIDPEIVNDRARRMAGGGAQSPAARQPLRSPVDDRGRSARLYKRS